MELVTTRQSDNTPINIIIYLVGSMSPDDPYYTVVFNIIMRKCLEYLNLQLVGREYFDAQSKVSNTLDIFSLFYKWKILQFLIIIV